MTKEKMTISVPRETLTDEELAKLRQIVKNYERLIKKSLKSRTAVVKDTEKEISFPWFTEPESPDEIGAYTELVNKLCDEARNRKSVRNQPAKDNGNDKYTFRCFLLRLGFIGPEYKTSRKVLLRNLSGNAAFRQPKEASDGE